MKAYKSLAIFSIALFSLVLILSVFKSAPKELPEPIAIKEAIELDLTTTNLTVEAEEPRAKITIEKQETLTPQQPIVQKTAKQKLEKLTPSTDTASLESNHSSQAPKDIDQVERLFSATGNNFPIVKTITYKKKVPWVRGRPAWIVDYASHYDTSTYFISRSLTSKADYFTQRYTEGDNFNIFNPNKDFYFYLLVDLSKSKMWFYYIDKGSENRVLIKTYGVGLGRQDTNRASGYLTPTGTYQLGKKVAIYKPGMEDFHKNKKVEMITVFGTRWIPFDKAIRDNSAPAKGFGIHGAPYDKDKKSHKLYEDISCIGKYESDGCIRLLTQDIEELFSIIITKPTLIEIVKNFEDHKMPGKEENSI